MCIYIFICMYKYVYMYIYLHMYVYVHVCVCIACGLIPKAWPVLPRECTATMSTLHTLYTLDTLYIAASLSHDSHSISPPIPVSRRIKAARHLSSWNKKTYVRLQQSRHVFLRQHDDMSSSSMRRHESLFDKNMFMSSSTVCTMIGIWKESRPHKKAAEDLDAGKNQGRAKRGRRF